MADFRGRLLLSIGGACVAAVVVAGFCLFWGSARTEGRTARCRANLAHIALALSNYHDRYRSFPPAYVLGPGRERYHSWRVLLLPYLGHEDLYREYRWDEPWNGPHNQRLQRRMPEVYACPDADNRVPHATNYVAVVDRATIWPEQHAASRRHVYDGDSQTLQMIECGNSDIHWMEPRDLTLAAAVPDDVAQPLPMSSTHRDFFHATFLDGNVRAMNSQVDRKILKAASSIAAGRTLPGVRDWPPPPLRPLPAGAITELPPPDDSTELPGTDVWPYAAVPIVRGRNTVYCCTFQLAWQELSELVDGPVELQGNPPLAMALNEHRFPAGSLSTDAYLALSGSGQAGLQRINDELARRFPNARPVLERRVTDHGIIMFAWLQKALPFAVEFDVPGQPLGFHTAAGRVAVAAFGDLFFEDTSERDDSIKRQIRVLDYVSDDDFVLELKTRAMQDELVLAKVSPGETLATTIAAVRERIARPDTRHNRFELVSGDSLIVPRLTANVRRDYPELIGRDIFRTSYYVHAATQVIRFRLDEAGAILESEAIIIGENGHGHHPEPDQPRQLIFDRPFLFYLRERSGAEPYFAAWVENAELLEPVASPRR